MSSVKHVRTVFAVNLRFPTPGQSASGSSGPKSRPRGVDNGYPVNIPELLRRSDEGTQRGRPAYDWSCRCIRRVGVEARRKIRELS